MGCSSSAERGPFDGQESLIEYDTVTHQFRRKPNPIDGAAKRLPRLTTYALETLADQIARGVALSPDGEEAALLVSRPLTTAERIQRWADAHIAAHDASEGCCLPPVPDHAPEEEPAAEAADAAGAPTSVVYLHGLSKGTQLPDRAQCLRPRPLNPIAPPPTSPAVAPKHGRVFTVDDASPSPALVVPP